MHSGALSHVHSLQKKTHQCCYKWNSSYLHNSDFRDSHEYTQKQVWGERILQGRVAGQNRLTEACSFVCYDFPDPYFLPHKFENFSFISSSIKKTICVHTDVSQI